MKTCDEFVICRRGAMVHTKVLHFHHFFNLKKLVSNCNLDQGEIKTIRIQENAE